MSEWRQDPWSGDWVAVAPGRGQRPHAILADTAWVDDAACPFCPGNEGMTPPEIARVSDAGGSWLVRVVPNRFPILDRDGVPEDAPERGLFRVQSVTGAHEVIIESRDHRADLATMPEDQLERVMTTYANRVGALQRRPEHRHVQLFRNRGRGAGASLSHPHAQIVASSAIPERAAQQLERSERHGRQTGRCLLCDVLRAERGAGTRWIEELEGYGVWAPYASRFPFELRLASLHHDESFGGLRSVRALARLLQRSLRRIHGALGDVAYNLMLDLPPRGDGAPSGAVHPWCIEVVPRTTQIAGYELGTGILVNLVAPEEAAELLRVRAQADMA